MGRKNRRRKMIPKSEPISYRSLAAPGSVDVDARTFDLVAATESRIPMPDFERMEMVDEVLLMSGARFGDQVPLLDSHNRYSVDDVLGSVRGMKVVGGELRGVGHLAEDQGALLARIRDGHVTDLSIGYRIDKKRFIPKDETQKIGGRDFTGPVNVVTQWSAREVSLTPIGADAGAKVRSDRGNPFETGDEGMNDFVRKLLVKYGMPADHDDEKAIAWLADRGMPADCEDVDEWVVANTDKLAPKRNVATPPPVVDTQAIAEAAARKAREEFAAELEAKKAARKDVDDRIREDCEYLDIADADAICREADGDYEKARTLIRDRRSNAPLGLYVGPSQFDKHTGAVRDALIIKSYRNARFGDERIETLLPTDQRANGWRELANCTLFQFAEECLMAHGVSTRGKSREQVAKMALGFDIMRGRTDYGWHTTGSFPQITLDAINKTLLAAYTERSLTYQQVFRQAESVPDFKNIHRIRLSEAPNLDVWADNQKPREVQFGDEKETYAVEAYANEVSFSWKLLVNDDMDALSRVPALMGRGAQRTVNAVVWAIITSNPTMTDGQALFSDVTGNRKKDNLGAAGAISETTLGEARKLMRLQVGMNQPDASASQAILGLTPKFLVFPAAIETTALKQIRSEFLPDSNTFMVLNQFRNLVPVVEPLLDANSATAWYMFADPSEIDTVEYCFLQGQETPVVDDWQDNSTLALKYRIMQTFAAKAIDHRGCFKNAGA